MDQNPVPPSPETTVGNVLTNNADPMIVKGYFQTHLKALSTGIILDREYRGKNLGFDTSMLTHKFMPRDPAPPSLFVRERFNQ
jgi:hypothetical protein